MSDPTDDEAIARIARDPDLFERFYREHVERVQRFIARRVDDPCLAADLTADVFLAVISSAESYRGDRGSVTAWVYGVAHNVVAANRRSQARELRARSRIAGRSLVDGDDLSAIDDRLAAEAQSRALYLAMAELPDGERAVLELTALEGLALTEVANALNIRPVTARVRLHRARRSMRDRLADPTAAQTSEQHSFPEVLK